jgi:hypothetical protein
MRCFALAAVCCVAVACTRVADDHARAGSGAAEPSLLCDSGAASPLRARADSLVSRLVIAINDPDPATVASLASFADQEPDTAAAAVAIEGFRHHLRGEIETCEFVGGEEGGDSHLEYRLVSGAGISKPVVVYHDAIRNHTHLYDEFLSYFARAQSYSRAMVDALSRRDAQRLARLLSVDDIDYPVELAEQAIGNYASRFDLPTLQIHYQGLEQESRTEHGPDVNRAFRYVIRGTRDARTVEHEVRITHGDGLLGWRDPLIPEYRGE